MPQAQKDEGIVLSKGDLGLLENCPVCRRVIWAGSICHHGVIPPPKKGFIGNPDGPPDEEPKKVSKKK